MNGTPRAITQALVGREERETFGERSVGRKDSCLGDLIFARVDVAIVRVGGIGEGNPIEGIGENGSHGSLLGTP